MRPDAPKSQNIVISCCVHFLRRVYRFVFMDSGPFVPVQPPAPPAGQERSCIEKGVMVMATNLDLSVEDKIQQSQL